MARNSLRPLVRHPFSRACLLLAVLLALASLLTAPPRRALASATFTVNSTGDTSDAAPGVGSGSNNPSHYVYADLVRLNGAVYNFQTTGPNTLVVDDDLLQCPEAAYTTIQDAVAAALPGDTIQVCAGNHTGPVNVNKTLTLLGAQSGVDAATRPGVPGTEAVVGGTDVGFSVAADGVVIDGFTVEGVTGLSPGAGAGISLSSSFSGYQILNNVIQNNRSGLRLGSSGATQTVVRDNAFRTNNVGPSSGVGIRSQNEQVARNILITSNDFTGHSLCSIIFGGAFQDTGNITVTGNTFVNDRAAMNFGVSTGVTISNNSMTGTTASTIFLSSSNDVSVTGNTATGGLSSFVVVGGAWTA